MVTAYLKVKSLGLDPSYVYIFGAMFCEQLQELEV